MVKLSEADNLPLVEAVYPMTAGLSAKVLRKAIEGGCRKLPVFPEWIDETLKTRQGFGDVASSFRELHDPRDSADIEPQAPARRRLAYDEFLAGQLSLALVRQRLRKVAGQPIRAKGDTAAKILSQLPFSLTASQSAAVKDILTDMAGEDPHVAAVAGRCGGRQDAGSVDGHGDGGGCRRTGGADGADENPRPPALCHHLQTRAGRGPHGGSADRPYQGQERREIEERVASGEAQIVIGTHALFQDSVTYKNLVLAVVDEQHRFGVASAPAPHCQGHHAAYAGHDRHAHSTHAGSGCLRGHGCLKAHRKTGAAANPSRP